MPPADQSVLLGRSAFMAPGDGRGDVKPGLRTDRRRRLPHHRRHSASSTGPSSTARTASGPATCRSSAWTRPWATAATPSRSGCSRSGRGPTRRSGDVNPSMGTLRLGVQGGRRQDAMAGRAARRDRHVSPGLHRVSTGRRQGRLEGHADHRAGHGLPRLGLPRRVRQGRCRWSGSTAASGGGPARPTPTGSRSAARRRASPSPICPTAWCWPVGTAQGEGRVVAGPAGQQAEFAATRPAGVYHVVAAWGVTRYDRAAGRQDHGPARHAGRRRLARSGAIG